MLKLMAGFDPKQTLEHDALSSHRANMENEPQQEALFELQGPDEDGCVWACSPAGRDVWCQNLGPATKVAEVMSQWLGSIQYDEVEMAK